ncbi:MAG: HD domain-containing protein [Chitinophagaceae bacterium]|nr:HD domain-containing protein [Chitinophagaceae bacterium]
MAYIELQKKIETIADEIISMYEQFGSEDYIGEPVSQIEHMCQCAELAETNGADRDTILAAFLHDIGHLYEFAQPKEKLVHMDTFGIVDHEKLGADYLLSRGFSENVAKMVASHVNAKRYLTFKYPEYYNLLSEASKNTLLHQGGIMTESEAAVFESDPLHQKYIALRKWDEQAKIEKQPVPSLTKYRYMIIIHLLENTIHNS